MLNIENLPFYNLLPVGVCSFKHFENALIPCRAINRIPDNAKSVIVYLFPYYLSEENYKNINLSKYAVSEDYHIICGEYLKKAAAELSLLYPQNSFSCFCDNSPIDEVKAACLAALGVKGENSLFINEEYGSFCFIGEIVTDLELPCENGEIKGCIKCGKCKSTCINNALCNGNRNDRQSVTENKIHRSQRCCIQTLKQRAASIF